MNTLLIEPLLIGPHVEPPIRKSKKKKRRQKRVSVEDHKRIVLAAMKKYQL